ncbi:MAG TPA: hypothetical protein VJH34_04360 [archaeon]|nr:hypothetical protein [archaeon]
MKLAIIAIIIAVVVVAAWFMTSNTSTPAVQTTGAASDAETLVQQELDNAISSTSQSLENALLS